MNNGEKIILRKGKKIDTLETKYGIMGIEDIEILEKENFLALKGNEKIKLRISQNGKILLKEN